MAETAAEIAARYGATVTPGVEVKKIPRGVSSRPLPVWNGTTLIIPDWKEHRARIQAATMRAARAGRVDAAVAARRAQVSALHAEGASIARMVEALAVTYHIVRMDHHHLGLRANRDEAAVSATLRDRANERAAPRRALLAKLIAEGADEARIAREMGIKDQSWLRRLIRDVAPDFPFVNRRRGCKPGTHRGRKLAPRGPTPAQVAMAKRLAPLLAAGLSFAVIGERLGLTRSAVSGHVVRLRAHGLLSGPGQDQPERRAA